MRNLLVNLLVFLPASIFAQSPPATDIYLLNISPKNDVPVVEAIQNVTDRDGYDNQPFFLPGGDAFLYTSMRDGQTDIFKYEIASGGTVQMTHTKESEYSPTPMPDGKHFSVVRVEFADSLVQRLWQFPLSGGEPSLLLANENPVGYHAWGDAQTVGLFVLGESITFRLAALATGGSEIIASDIGRSLHKIPGEHAISFTQNVPIADDSTKRKKLINKLSLDTGKITTIGDILFEEDDYAWLDEKHILAGSESALYQLEIGGDAWELILNLSAEGVKKITRIGVSPNGKYLALVGNRE